MITAAASSPGRVGQHPDDDDVHVADDVSDGSGEYLENRRRLNFAPLPPAHSLGSFWLAPWGAAKLTKAMK